MAQDNNNAQKTREEKLIEMRRDGRDPYEITRFDVTHSMTYIKEHYDELEGKTVRTAGRLMAKRRAGGLIFADVLDRDEKIQFYLKRDEIGEETFNRFKLETDVWDVIGAQGVVFKTVAGEISINVSSYVLLAKNLFIPVKANDWVNNRVSDHDIRYRQRYMDLIANPSVRETFKKRSAIIREIRNYLDERDFLEVDTPVLNTISGGATAKPFVTHHNALDIDMYLRIATELNLKRLIVGGLERVYEMGRQFRNEGMDLKHNPEFTTIEIYQAYTDYEGMMKLTEGLVSTVCEKVNGTQKITYDGSEIDFTAPWARMTMKEAVRKYAGIDFDALSDVDEAKSALKNIGIDPADKKTMGELLALAFEEKAEDNLEGPIFITEYPVEVSPLAKRCPKNKAFTERFEAFVHGCELGNAFSELNDPDDQRERFEAQVAAREAGDEEAGMMDEDYITALRYGMPPTGGVGIGIDRLVMFLTDNTSIRDVILFPTMKPIGGANKKSDARPTAPASAESAAKPEKKEACAVSREKALELLKKYNKDSFHIRHAYTVEAVMRWYARDLGVGNEDFWGLAGLLHDIDFELYPEEHCKKAPEMLAEIDAPAELIHAVVSHGYGICSDTEPVEIMEKVLFASDELTGLIGACALMRPSKSCADMELKSLKKKFKDKRFAAGCSREVIARGAEMLGWETDELLEKTLEAMKESETLIADEMAEAEESVN